MLIHKDTKKTAESEGRWNDITRKRLFDKKSLIE